MDNHTKTGSSRPRLWPIPIGRVAWVATAAAVAALMAGCGSSNVNAGASSGTGGSKACSHGVKVGLVGFADSNDLTEAVYKQMQVEALKVHATVGLIDGGLDPTTQATAMQDAIQTGQYCALVVQPIDAVSLQTQVLQAARAGIKVIALDYTFGAPARQAKLVQTIPQVESTIGLARNVVTQTFVNNIKAACTAKVGSGKACQVGLQPGSRATAFSSLTSSSIASALAKTGYIHTSFAPDGDFTTSGGYSSMKTFLENHRNVDVMWSEGDQQTVGMVEAVKSAGLRPGKDIEITSYSGTTEAVAGIRNGTWYSSVPIYPQEGTKAVEQAVALAKGKSVPAVTSEYTLPGAWPDLTPATLKVHPSFQSVWSTSG